jgi:pimeloyl-ACP methyl ester carboxylesterase
VVAGRNVAVLLGACLALAACIYASSAGSDQMIDIGSHRLQFHQEGDGAPAVVVDAGLADQLEKLKPLQERLSGVTRVITYNRAGYGQSDPGPLPRDSGQEAEELKALLERASIPEPYVLVGHSLGALNVQVFASKYPKAVAGMVLMDPPPLSFILGQEWGELRGMAERMTTEWQAIADSAGESADVQGKMKSAFFRMIASEHREMFGQSAKLVSAAATFGDKPLVVIASGKPNPAFGEAAEKFQQYWVGQNRALAGKSTAGKFILAEGASHFLYVDVPELVVETVRSIVQEARAK